MISIILYTLQQNIVCKVCCIAKDIPRRKIVVYVSAYSYLKSVPSFFATCFVPCKYFEHGHGFICSNDPNNQIISTISSKKKRNQSMPYQIAMSNANNVSRFSVVMKSSKQERLVLIHNNYIKSNLDNIYAVCLFYGQSSSNSRDSYKKS